jgi:hypothetical protein
VAGGVLLYLCGYRFPVLVAGLAMTQGHACGFTVVLAIDQYSCATAGQGQRTIARYLHCYRRDAR